MKQVTNKSKTSSIPKEKMKSSNPEWVFGLKILVPCSIPKISAMTAGTGGSAPSTVPIYVGGILGALEGGL